MTAILWVVLTMTPWSLVALEGFEVLLSNPVTS
jgi:hypothetical protein